jgi:hypothetical protein
VKRIAFLLLVTVLVAAIPSGAQTLYSNGPVNGTTDAWTINFGFVVSDTFTLSSASTVTGVNFYAWLVGTDTIQSAEIAITSSEFGGTTYTDQIVNFTMSGCSANQLGYNVCLESSAGMTPVNLAAGTYWLNLENACCTLGDPFYWDENSGVSSASENSVGTIPSEAFTVLGTAQTSTSATSTTPEPTSVMLWGSGDYRIGGRDSA